MVSLCRTLNVDTNSFVFFDVSTPHLKNAEVAYSNQFNPTGGTIISNENYKDKDKNLDGQRLWPSEVLWQCYQQAANDAGVATSKLQFIVRYCVVNKSSLIAIWQAARFSTATSEGPNGSKVYSPPDDGFFAVLGSPNGASTMRMLIEHKSLIGYRKVERVLIDGCEAQEHTEDDRKSRTFVIELSNTRELPAPRELPTKTPRPVSGTPLGRCRRH